MFSNNQLFNVSCESDGLETVIRAAIGLYGEDLFTRTDNPVRLAFSKPIPGVYALGTDSMSNTSPAPKGWTDYPFDYDPKIVAMIIDKWVSKQNPPDKMPSTDGSCERGVRVQSILSLCNDENSQFAYDLNMAVDKGAWDAAPCIVLFTPTWLIYDK